jgi:hypothetical protein
MRHILTTAELSLLNFLHEYAVAYHDSPATKGYHCQEWKTCRCHRAVDLRCGKNLIDTLSREA